MCYTATQVTKANKLQEVYGAKLAPSLSPDYDSEFYKADGFEHPELLAVLVNKGERLIDKLMWGLMPTWSKPLDEMLEHSNRTLNARSEDIRTTASFKHAIIKHRCIIPVNSFFEYKHIFNEKGKKIDTQPFLIKPKESSFFTLAGIFSYYKDNVMDRWFKTFSIVTEPANLFMADIHNHAKRMPLMLSNDLIDDWLNPDSPPSMIDEIMKYACDDSSLEAYQVQRQLKTLPNTRDVLRPFNEQPESPTQTDLFNS